MGSTNENQLANLKKPLLVGALVAGTLVWTIGSKNNPLPKQFLVDESVLSRPIKKRCILISGAASGIGLSTAKLFISKGWYVGCCDINEEALHREFSLEKERGNAFLEYLDVTNPESCADAARSFTDATGGYLDVLFNCAGLLAIGKFEELSLQRQNAQIDVNCKGVVNLTYKCIPALLKSHGCIVTMASLSSIGGIPMHAVYAATKAYVYSLTESLRTEFGYRGVRVCDVAAPYADTPMTQNQEYKGGLFSRKETFVRPQTVAQKVYEAVHNASFYNEHFYVGDDTQKTFTLTWLSRVLGLKSHTDQIRQSFKLPSAL